MHSRPHSSCIVDSCTSKVGTEEDRPYQIKVNCKTRCIMCVRWSEHWTFVRGSSDRFSSVAEQSKEGALYFQAHCHQEHTFDGPTTVSMNILHSLNTFATHRRLILADKAIEKHWLANACRAKVHSTAAAYSWPIYMVSLGKDCVQCSFSQCLLSRLMSMSVHLATLNSSLPERAHNSRQSSHHLDGRVCANWNHYNKHCMKQLFSPFCIFEPCKAAMSTFASLPPLCALSFPSFSLSYLTFS